MNVSLRILAVSLVVASPAVAQADTIFQKRGAPLRGRVWEETDQEVVVNVFRTAVRSVTHGTERVPKKKVKRVVRDAHPHLTFWRRARELKDADSAAWVKLAEETGRRKGLKELQAHACVEALVRDPENPAARKALGKQWKALQKEDPRFNPALREKLAAYVATTDFAAREALYEELQALGEARPFTYLERAVRSSRIPRGRHDKRPLTLRSVETSGTYCLFVPKGYDPLVPTPLVIGLHGGGPGGKDGNLVVGSGESLMSSWLQQAASRRGWLVACPTAKRAPWSRRENDPLILAVVEEMGLTFNVDRNRIYLAGHSMGGFGTWHHGPKYAHLWAAIGPAAGGGRPDLKKLTDTRTGVHCYHGADDSVVGPGRDRRVAEQMRKREMDFVYCEMDDAGHGWPADAREEMWRYFEVRRLAVAPGRRTRGRFRISQTPMSSFAAKPTREEIRYFGHPGKAPDARRSLKALLADLDAGGGLAERAADALAKMKDRRAASQVAKRLGPKRQLATRRCAARALGEMGQDVAVKPLEKALKDPDLVVVGAAARALGGIPSPSTPKAWSRCAADLAARFVEKRGFGGRYDYSDYELFLDTVRALVEGAERLKSPDALPALRTVAEEFVLRRIDVRTSRRAGEDAARPHGRLVGALRTALDAIGGEEAGALAKRVADASSR